MYSRYAERQKWQVEFVSASPSDLGGYKEIVVKIVGQGAYSKLKFESGGHRVQRVPETESQGRVHTSACTVAVLPAVSTFRKQRVLSVLRTFLPALWSSAKTSGASTKTKKEPWAF